MVGLGCSQVILVVIRRLSAITDDNVDQNRRKLSLLQMARHRSPRPLGQTLVSADCIPVVERMQQWG